MLTNRLNLRSPRFVRALRNSIEHYLDPEALQDRTPSNPKLSGYMIAFSSEDTAFMENALTQARAAETIDEVPVGAVLVAADGTILAESHNRTISLSDPCAHAEILALRAAGQKLGNYRLLDTTLYVTLEPCAMCAMALVHARVKRVVFAASDPKTGACGSVFDLLSDPRHNHQVQVQGGLLADEASAMLSAYFKAKRKLK